VGWLNRHDLYVAANQEYTRQWWAERRHAFDLYASAVVLQEAGDGTAPHRSSWKAEMIEDPIVEEVHRTRERLLAEHGGMEGFLKHIRQIQEQMKDRVVRLEPKTPVATTRKIS
jgi:hypothetical protein